MMLTRTVVAVAALALTTLAGCGSSSDSTASSAAPAATATSASATAAALTVRDPWVKAADTGMTAAFATLVNNTGADVTVESASSPASPLELHTMTMKDGAMVMEPKEGGFVIKAGGTHELSPGGDHLMLMKPSAPVKPGDELSFTLKLAGGGTVDFTAVAKPFAGAQESYDPGMSMPSASAGAHQ
ncbi:MAG TPA: copper chaperone PCu(A)C [Actinoplanes sp.]|nr:copper chaperone PCu(A)C [Actinoplanes sp.]